MPNYQPRPKPISVPRANLSQATLLLGEAIAKIEALEDPDDESWLEEARFYLRQLQILVG